MGTGVFLAMGVFPVELLAYQVNGLCWKLAKIPLQCNCILDIILG